ncbi:MAG: hypothetical protein IJX90_10015 [Blautia sp.]|nr:hypothetical protein [Blautia sp.]
MDNFEKVEKLRERANVSYEEAKGALEQSGWDLLDAMVLLEKQGKTAGPQKTSYSTDYDQQEDYAPVEKTVYNEEKEKGRARRSFRALVRDFIRICRDNAFVVTRKEREVFRVPVSILVLVVLFIWKLALPVLLVGLFLGFKYSFEGKDDLTKANELINSAENVANYVKNEFSGSNDTEE